MLGDCRKCGKSPGCPALVAAPGLVPGADDVGFFGRLFRGWVVFIIDLAAARRLSGGDRTPYGGPRASPPAAASLSRRICRRRGRTPAD